MPKFDGTNTKCAKCKREFEKSILPNFDEEKQIMLLDEFTPKNVYLQNCRTVAEVWKILGARFANPHTVTANLMDEFAEYQAKGCSQESKLVHLRDFLETIDAKLTAVSSK